MLDLYTHYLINSTKYMTATGLSRLFNNRFSHDKVTRFLNSQNRENVIWGDISMVKATINLMDAVRKDYSGICSNVLLSGNDYPIKPKEFIKKYLTDNYDKIFLSSKHVQDVWGIKTAKKTIECIQRTPRADGTY